MSLVPESDFGDVKIFLNTGSVIEASEYTEHDDYTVKLDGVTLHLGPVIIANGQVIPKSLIEKITATVKTVEERVVYGKKRPVDFDTIVGTGNGKAVSGGFTFNKKAE